MIQKAVAKQTIQKIGKRINAGAVEVNNAKGWSSLPIWAKVGIIGIGAFGAYKGVKFLLKNTKLDPQTRDSKQEEEGWNRQFEKDGGESSATMTKTEMKQIANTLFNAMDGYGTRDGDITRAFKRIKTNADFSGVNSAYGTRTLQPGHGIGWLAPKFKGTLTECLQEEADAATIKSINAYLTAQKIKYKI